MLNHRHEPSSPLSTSVLHLKPPSLPDLYRLVENLQPQNHPDDAGAVAQRITRRAIARGGNLRIGLYDGSFDPPHYGHVETARAAIPRAALDLVVMTCHPKPSLIKPNLSPHGARTEMLSSYFTGDRTAIVSPLPRSEIENILSEFRVVGIIGSDAFERFLTYGIPNNFTTDEILVAERATVPLNNAPVTLAGRPVWYISRNHLAHNESCSTEIRDALAGSANEPIHHMLNRSTDRIARANRLYEHHRPHAPEMDADQESSREVPPYMVPTAYAGCKIVPRRGLENGLLSESYIFEVRAPSGSILAFMKTLPPHRDPLNHIRDEAYGLALFNTLGLRTASAPEAILTTDNPCIWIARAPGETPGTLIRRYEQGIGTAQDIYDALYAVGECLQELHTRHSEPFDTKAHELLETYIEHHEGIIARAMPDTLRADTLQRAIRSLREDGSYLRARGVRCSLTHGDANPGNFLWDTEAKWLSVIDLHRLGTQARTGASAFPTYECGAFLNTLRYYPNIGFKGRRGGLSKACAAYKAGYGPVDPREERFFQSLRSIRATLAGHERIHEITRKTPPGTPSSI